VFKAVGWRNQGGKNFEKPKLKWNPPNLLGGTKGEKRENKTDLAKKDL